MDKISEFFKELKDRFSNPLFFSFIVAWMALNWKIIVGLMFYKLPELKNDGYSSFLDLINKTSNIYNSLLYPFLIALLYTFLFPIIRNCIAMFNAWNQKWGNEKTLSISKDGKISVAKYIQLREIYEKRKLTIEEVLEKESTYLKENETLKSDLSTSAMKAKKSEDEMELIKYLNDINRFMEGDWLIRIGSSHDMTRVKILGGKIYENKDFSLGAHIYTINHLAYNTFNYEMILILTDLQTSDKILTEVFRAEVHFKVFKNKSNKGGIMEMKKED